MHNDIIIISDLHLSTETERLNQQFKLCLHNWQGKIQALYILGDLFEVWVGDDDQSPFITTQLQLLHAFSQKTPLFIMRGNRDFLLGEAFAKQTGAILIEDPFVLTLGANNYILSHGDELCTDDLPYQQFRQQTRNPLWQQAILAKPLQERYLLAAQIRQMSESKKNTEGKNSISDATEAGVQQLIQRFSKQFSNQIPTLIHGHTHRPAIHSHRFQEKPFNRYVIADWFETDHSIEGGFLKINENGISIQPLNEY